MIENFKKIMKWKMNKFDNKTQILFLFFINILYIK